MPALHHSHGPCRGWHQGGNTPPRTGRTTRRGQPTQTPLFEPLRATDGNRPQTRRVLVTRMALGALRKPRSVPVDTVTEVRRLDLQVARVCVGHLRLPGIDEQVSWGYDYVRLDAGLRQSPRRSGAWARSRGCRPIMHANGFSPDFPHLTTDGYVP